MPILLKVEAKSVKGRLFQGLTILALSLGGMTMLYPFLLMLSGAFRSEMDENDLDLIPAFFFEDNVLYQKFIEFKYEQDIGMFNRAHLRRDFSFRLVDPPEYVSPGAVSDLRQFLDEGDVPTHWQTLGGVAGSKTVPENLRTLRQRLAKAFDNDLDAFSRESGTAVTGWMQTVFPTPDWLSNRFDLETNTFTREYLKLLQEAPVAERQLVSLTGYFLELILYPRYGDVASVNDRFGLNLQSWAEFRLPSTLPEAGPAEGDALLLSARDLPGFQNEWVEFILQDLNASFVLVEDIAPTLYQEFLREQYLGEITELNAVWRRDYSCFSEISLPMGEYLSGSIRQDYNDFLKIIHPSHWRLTGPEYAWHNWLHRKYDGQIEALNAAHGRNHQFFREVWMPLGEMEWSYTLEKKGLLRRTFALRNFVNVFDAIFLEGRIFANTVIFCALSVILALLVNPLAAYALSRFQLPGTYKILLLMMAVMAFPPMVTTIPVFIMMKNFGLMNTFAGLLLPTIANGYLIYLLKGFFDSLPRELYEAAQIEGASEIRMFFSITMALSKPILAVVGLTAFNGSYSIFLYALIIAPEQDMWLLSVWLYQYRESVSTAGVFASVLVASLPPIIVFLFAQNIILRGIVVPIEK